MLDTGMMAAQASKRMQHTGETAGARDPTAGRRAGVLETPGAIAGVLETLGTPAGGLETPGTPAGVLETLGAIAGVLEIHWTSA